MRKSRFSNAQIVGIIREYDAGASPAELARRHGVHLTRSASGKPSTAAWK
ncbi:MAG: transposase [Candidatus Eremiobacteraeota bacterium]|nr:transposase [Candidatus Eremiobacteraeota bacterium]